MDRLHRYVNVPVDSNHAGCLRTRRSTTITVVMLGRHRMKSSSDLQSTIAVSNGERVLRQSEARSNMDAGAISVGGLGLSSNKNSGQ